MSNQHIQEWHRANQQYLMAALQVVKEHLLMYEAAEEETEAGEEALQTAMEALETATEAMPAPSALDMVTRVFGLSLFERQVLLLCAGVELDSRFAALVTSLQGGPPAWLPTFGMALAALPGAHWSALAPHAALRYWHLVELTNDAVISRSPLKIDEHILHYLTGVHQPDEKLAGITLPVYSHTTLVPSQLSVAGTIINACTKKTPDGILPVIQLCGDNSHDKESMAAYVCAQLGVNLHTLSVFTIPSTIRELTELSVIWNREAALKSAALLIDYTELDTTDKTRMQYVHRFIEQVQGLIFLSCSQQTLKLNRSTHGFFIDKPTAPEQLELWQQHLGPLAGMLDGHLSRVVSQFNLSASTIGTTSVSLVQQLTATDTNTTAAGSLIWKTCCASTRPHVEALAQRIVPMATLDDIVLPQAQKEILKEIAIQVRQRNRVYTDWGFASRSSRGLGITALFAGESGTGKTMAAEVLANVLDLDLYKIDLSQVINKYVGETEKNLKQIFDAAEDGGAILLFDEADALFGKRSEVRDSHDRYANIEVSYLLQRMEAYRGLAILTTNMKSTMDKAWMRRIRFVVQFPFPDLEQREAIWRRVFPADTPLSEIRPDKLARLNVAGGNIRNIALNAAFLAADEGRPVNMGHLSRAARSEYNKLEKSLQQTEIGSW